MNSLKTKIHIDQIQFDQVCGVVVCLITKKMLGRVMDNVSWQGEEKSLQDITAWRKINLPPREWCED